MLKLGNLLACSVGILLIQFAFCSQAHACTIGVASGYVTTDGRPILWKTGDGADSRQHLAFVDDSPHNYLVTRSGDSGVFNGLNDAGVALGNTWVGGACNNSAPQEYVLKHCASLSEIRDYIHEEVTAGRCNASGCFPFIDAQGNASIFEINRSDWFLEYDSMDPDRQAQGLYGFVVRANEFHERTDGTDDTSITGGRYESGTYNTSGLVGSDMLCARTIVQGNDGANGFEFLRYGPGRSLATIARSFTRTARVVHGVAPGEDPALATMWVILGQPNYGIAVPAWVRVSDIPQCLASGDMYDRAKSLYQKGAETVTQASVLPAEAHLFDEVEELLTYWREEGVPSVTEMTRVEHRMAEDAYSLLDCLDNTQSDNKAPDVAFNLFTDGLAVDFALTAADLDGTIDDIEWNFGDGLTSTETSPSHTYAELGTYLVSCTVTDDDGVSITDWSYCVVPEPTAVALLALGGLGLIRRRRLGR